MEQLKVDSLASVMDYSRLLVDIEAALDLGYDEFSKRRHDPANGKKDLAVRDIFFSYGCHKNRIQCQRGLYLLDRFHEEIIMPRKQQEIRILDEKLMMRVKDLHIGHEEPTHLIRHTSKSAVVGIPRWKMKNDKNDSKFLSTILVEKDTAPLTYEKSLRFPQWRASDFNFNV